MMHSLSGGLYSIVEMHHPEAEPAVAVQGSQYMSSEEIESILRLQCIQPCTPHSGMVRHAG